MVGLPINPRLVGTLVDETGSIGSGKLVWSTEAWEQLLGRSAETLVASSITVLKYMEQRLAYLRLSLLFGWSEDVGKLAVCQVRMRSRLQIDIAGSVPLSSKYERCWNAA